MLFVIFAISEILHEVSVCCNIIKRMFLIWASLPQYKSYGKFIYIVTIAVTLIFVMYDIKI